MTGRAPLHPYLIPVHISQGGEGRFLERRRADSFSGPAMPDSFDHLVCAGEERGRDREAKGLGSSKIDTQSELSRLFDRQIGWFRAIQNFVNVRRAATTQIK